MVSVQLLQASAAAATIGVGTHGGSDKSAVALRQASAECRVGKIIPLVAPRYDFAVQVGSLTWVMQVSAGQFIWHLKTGLTMSDITVNEGQEVTIWVRLTTAERDQLLKADVSTILVNVFDTDADDRANPVYQNDLTLSLVMFDALQLTNGWRGDAVGYAFKYTLPGTIFAEGGRTYRTELVFRTVSHGPLVPVVLIKTEPLMTPFSEIS